MKVDLIFSKTMRTLLIFLCLGVFVACANQGNDDDDDDMTLAPQTETEDTIGTTETPTETASETSQSNETDSNSQARCSDYTLAEMDSICIGAEGTDDQTMEETENEMTYYANAEGNHVFEVEATNTTPGLSFTLTPNDTDPLNGVTVSRMSYQVGTFPFTIYAISSGCGNSTIELEAFGDVGEAVQGSFQGELYKYNFNGTNNDHSFDCEDSLEVSGAFQVTLDEMPESSDDMVGNTTSTSCSSDDLPTNDYSLCYSLDETTSNWNQNNERTLLLYQQESGTYELKMDATDDQAGVSLEFTTSEEETMLTSVTYQVGTFPFTIYTFSSSCGEGTLELTSTGDIGERFSGTFEAQVYKYNFTGMNNDHSFDCEDSQSISGLFAVELQAAPVEE